jgi:hypothetical protein
LSFVIDSSVAVSWCFEDEQTPATLDVLEQVVEGGAIAPALWPLEVLNALCMAERSQAARRGGASPPDRFLTRSACYHRRRNRLASLDRDHVSPSRIV